MYSFSFPNMLSTNKANLLEDKEATMSNLKLLLGSVRTSLFGDPYYGTNILRLIYEQNDLLLSSILIDELYTSILTFIPQVRVDRKNITITKDGTNVTKDKRKKVDDGKHLYAHIVCTYVLDNSTLDFTIRLLGDEE